MDRRSFFRLMAAGLAAPAIIEPVPLVKYFFAPVGGWSQSGNTILTVPMITREAMAILRQNLQFIKYRPEPYFRVGSSINIRMPKRYALATL